MKRPTIQIFNSETGEEIIREMNDEEFASFSEMKIKTETVKAEAEAKETARLSALEKLAALGLTEAEIQALAG